MKHWFFSVDEQGQVIWSWAAVAIVAIAILLVVAVAAVTFLRKASCRWHCHNY